MLNLFGYTGGATLACLAAGASVTHVDASKGMVAWARENAAASELADRPCRWIVDDCAKYVQRELRRGSRYDAVIMDPPSYGRGPGGDVEAGLALAELIAGVSKPSATLVLGGGHSIGIPLAVSARHSFIVPTATMTVHPVRHSGLILGVPQTMHCFEQMQQRITGFVAAHSGMPEKRYTQLMLHTGELVMDMGTVLDGRRAVKEKLIDELGGLSDALAWLYKEIEQG